MNKPFISALDFVSLREGETPADAISRAINFAQQVEALGYHRLWVPEHHGNSAFASASPALVISRIAEATRLIRVGAGGVMLLNHAPMIVAEQFGTLEWMYPGRIDLGVGRAVGSKASREEITKKALRRDPNVTGDDFADLLKELLYCLGPKQEDQAIEISPGQNTNVPVFLLSSSGYSARLAGELGLPFVFATHISSANLISSLQIYRQHFQPSEVLNRPYVMVAAYAYAAERDQEAQQSVTTMQQFYVGMARNRSAKMRPPVASMDGLWTAEEQQAIERKTQWATIGGRETVRRSLQSLVEETNADELLFVTEAYSDADRLLSYSIMAEVVASL